MPKQISPSRRSKLADKRAKTIKKVASGKAKDTLFSDARDQEIVRQARAKGFKSERKLSKDKTHVVRPSTKSIAVKAAKFLTKERISTAPKWKSPPKRKK